MKVFHVRACVLPAVSATLILAHFCGVAHTATDESTTGKYEMLANIPYVTRGEQPLRMNLYVPEGEGPFPAVMLVHGGAWRMGNRWHMHSVAQKLASRGYTVASISYRFAPAHRFPAQLEDCADAVRFLRKTHRSTNVIPSGLVDSVIPPEGTW